MKAVVFLSLFTLLFSSCKKECYTGFYGANCNLEVRLKYIGWYKGKSKIGSTEFDNSANVSVNSNIPNEFLLDGKICRLKTNNSFDLIKQNDLVNTGFSYEGYGTITESKLTYTISTWYYGDYQLTETFLGTR